MSDSATPRTTAHQASLSMGLSRQKYWSGLPFPPPGDLPDPGIEPRSPGVQADSLPSEPPGKPLIKHGQKHPQGVLLPWTRHLALRKGLGHRKASALTGKGHTFSARTYSAGHGRQPARTAPIWAQGRQVPLWFKAPAGAHEMVSERSLYPGDSVHPVRGQCSRQCSRRGGRGGLATGGARGVDSARGWA